MNSLARWPVYRTCRIAGVGHSDTYASFRILIRSSVDVASLHHIVAAHPQKESDRLFVLRRDGGDGAPVLRSPCPILGVLGPAREGPRAAPAGHALSVGHEDQALSGKRAIRGTRIAQGLDPGADAPGALAQLSGSHGGLGQAIYRDGGRRAGGEGTPGFTPCTRHATLGFAACRR